MPHFTQRSWRLGVQKLTQHPTLTSGGRVPVPPLPPPPPQHKVEDLPHAGEQTGPTHHRQATEAVTLTNS